MLILAFETSTDLASCALWHDGAISTVDCLRSVGQEGQHSATLLPAAKQLLVDSGVSFQALDAIAFGAGPGAFTGLRMACAIAQGVAVAHDKPVLPVTTLAAMAWQAGKRLRSNPVLHRSCQITALLDARMGEVYAGQFVLTQSSVRQVGEIMLRSPSELLDEPDFARDSGPQILCGNVFSEYPQLTDYYSGGEHVLLSDLVPHARELVELAAESFAQEGGVSPELAAPLYIRDRVAKTIVERIAEGGRA